MYNKVRNEICGWSRRVKVIASIVACLSLGAAAALGTLWQKEKLASPHSMSESDENVSSNNANGNSDSSQFDFNVATFPSSYPDDDRPTVSPSTSNNDPQLSAFTIKPSPWPDLRVATRHPTRFPTRTPTRRPTKAPTAVPTVEPPLDTKTVFCVIADVPYTEQEAAALPGQLDSQMEDCEFLVHLGDLLSGDQSCDLTHYDFLQQTLLDHSKIPTFVILGDNEWNDCGGFTAIQQGWTYWTERFLRFEDNWLHSLQVQHHSTRTEVFYFVHKRTLFIGLNLVGGSVHSQSEWRDRLDDEQNWVQQLVTEHVINNSDALGVIMFGHANPTESHRGFFSPINQFVADHPEIPFLYLHGDGHKWIYDPSYQNSSNYLRIQHEGGVRDPVLRIIADPYNDGLSVQTSFRYDRQLYLER